MAPPATALEYDKLEKITNNSVPLYEVESVEFAFKDIAAIPKGVQTVINKFYSVKNIIITGNGAIESVEWPNKVLESVGKFDIQKGFTGSTFKNGLPKNLDRLKGINELKLHANVEYFSNDAFQQLFARCGDTSTVRINIENEYLFNLAFRTVTQPESNWQHDTEIQYAGNVYYLNSSYGHFGIDITAVDQVKSDLLDSLEDLKTIKIESMLQVIDKFDMFKKLIDKSLETLEHLMILNVKLAGDIDTLSTIDEYIISLRGNYKSFGNLKSLSVSTALITEDGMEGIIEPMQSLINEGMIELVVSFVPQIDPDQTFEIDLEELTVPADLCELDDWKKFNTDERVGCYQPISDEVRSGLLEGDSPKWVSELIEDATSKE